jgi:hypothetical protein
VQGPEENLKSTAESIFYAVQNGVVTDVAPHGDEAADGVNREPAESRRGPRLSHSTASRTRRSLVNRGP